jgi:hypothetical protein
MLVSENLPEKEIFKKIKSPDHNLKKLLFNKNKILPTFIVKLFNGKNKLPNKKNIKKWKNCLLEAAQTQLQL